MTGHLVANSNFSSTQQSQTSVEPLTIFALTSVMVISAFGNSLVIAAFRRFRQLRTVTNYFLVSLAAADLLASLLSIPCWLVIRVLQVKETPLQELEYMVPYFTWQFVDIVSSTASITSLCVIGVDRHLAISAPLTYRAHMTSRRALVAIACCWLYAASCASLSFITLRDGWQPVAGKFYAVFISLAAFFIPLLVLLTFYGRIFAIALRQARSLTTEDSMIYGAEKERRSVLRRELKITKTVAMVVGGFVVCWAPFFTILMYFAVCSPRCVITAVWVAVSKWLHYCSTIINPIIYTLFNQCYRRAFRRMICGSTICQMLSPKKVKRMSRAELVDANASRATELLTVF